MPRKAGAFVSKVSILMVQEKKAWVRHCGSAFVTSIWVIFLWKVSIRALIDKNTLNKTRQPPAGWKTRQAHNVCLGDTLMFEIPVSLLSLMESWFASEGERGGKKERISKRGGLVRQ